MSRQSRRDTERSGDILDAIAKIERWRAARNHADDMFRSAVMRELAVIGEAVNGLSDGFKTSRPEIPWRSIVDLRNVLTHHYWDTAWALIEHLLDDELEELRRSVAKSFMSTGPLVAAEDASSSQLAEGVCHLWMPRARTHCVLMSGHAGGCRSK